MSAVMPTVKSNVNDVFGANPSSRRFEFVDVMEFEGAKYAALLPVLDGPCLEVVILAVSEKGDDSVNGSFASVTDAGLLDRVYAVFLEKNAAKLGLANTV